MVRPNRTKEYSFTVANLTAGAGTNHVDVYTDHVINGTLQKISYYDGNWAANGSLMIFVSGAVQETIWVYKNATADQVVYPFVYPINSVNVTGSPQVGVQPVVNSLLRVVGSGVAAGKSGLGLTIYYI